MYSRNDMHYKNAVDLQIDRLNDSLTVCRD